LEFSSFFESWNIPTFEGAIFPESWHVPLFFEFRFRTIQKLQALKIRKNISVKNFTVPAVKNGSVLFGRFYF